MQKWIWFFVWLGLLATGCDDDKPISTPAEDCCTAPDAEPVLMDMSVVSDGGETSTLEVPGLTAPVKARFDGAGILHLTCQTDADCIAAQGYFHAANRFLQMDLNRRFPQGRLGERVGSFARDFDQGNRMIIATQTGERIEERMLQAADEPTRTALEAYTRGVNAWLGDMRADRNDAKLSEEYDFPVIHKDTIDDWVQTDSLVCTLLLVKSLTDTSTDEVHIGESSTNSTCDYTTVRSLSTKTNTKTRSK